MNTGHRPSVVPRVGSRLAGIAAALLLVWPSVARPAAGPWVPDRGDGTYQNPVLHADYSDPDVIRVGDDYWLTSSSFNHVPALPILHSRDLVNWEIVNHALPELVPVDHFRTVRHGQGVWAPAIRFHGGRYWIYYPDPDFGIYVVTADDPRGRWSTPVLVKPGKGLIDPCPLWDDDGQVYLVHAWAHSRGPVSNRLSLCRLSPDGLRAVDESRDIIDANKLEGWRTLEGPKLYKRRGYYYVFAPAGGVKDGYQAVFRSKQIYGPYENRIVLAQDGTPINGPHQGAWVDTPTGENWFIHFQDKEAYGRVVHLQPMAWRDDDWPVMGTAVESAAVKGAPVLTHAKPRSTATAILTPATSDEFDAPELGRQWQWQANPIAGWATLTAKHGTLRLTPVSLPSGGMYDAPNLLMQKFPAPRFTTTTDLDATALGDGAQAGLVVFGYSYAWIGVRRAGDQFALAHALNHEHDTTKKAVKPQSNETLIALPTGHVQLRVSVDEQAICRFAYSTDGRTFTPAGAPFQASVDRWVGAKVGVFASAVSTSSAERGYADFEWFRVEK